MTPPTWRALAARARGLGLELVTGTHEAALVDANHVERQRVSSWFNRKIDAFILRSAVAAALEQLEARR